MPAFCRPPPTLGCLLSVDPPPIDLDGWMAARTRGDGCAARDRTTVRDDDDDEEEDVTRGARTMDDA